jgi:hypothetical protein
VTEEIHVYVNPSGSKSLMYRSLSAPSSGINSLVSNVTVSPITRSVPVVVPRVVLMILFEISQLELKVTASSSKLV